LLLLGLILTGLLAKQFAPYPAGEEFLEFINKPVPSRWCGVWNGGWFEFGLWLTINLWTGVARVVRGSIIALRHREFVEAAHGAGASGPRIILRHLLPNASGPLIVAGTSLIGQSIVIVATVTFLGLGTVQAEKPSLGTLVADAARGTGGNVFGSVSTPWWIYVFPSVLLVLMLLCVNFLGDMLDEVLNPTSDAGR
jgi:peptide/nickel transport system permease protein